MTDRAREVIARGVAARHGIGDYEWDWRIGSHGREAFRDDAEAALAALEAEGLAVQSADEVEARIAEAVAAKDERINAALRQLDEQLKYKRAAAISRGALSEADRLMDQLRGVLEATAAIRGGNHDG